MGKYLSNGLVLNVRNGGDQMVSNCMSASIKALSMPCLVLCSQLKAGNNNSNNNGFDSEQESFTVST